MIYLFGLGCFTAVVESDTSQVSPLNEPATEPSSDLQLEQIQSLDSTQLPQADVAAPDRRR